MSFKLWFIWHTCNQFTIECRVTTVCAMTATTPTSEDNESDTLKWHLVKCWNYRWWWKVWCDQLCIVNRSSFFDKFKTLRNIKNSSFRRIKCWWNIEENWIEISSSISWSIEMDYFCFVWNQIYGWNRIFVANQIKCAKRNWLVFIFENAKID